MSTESSSAAGGTPAPVMIAAAASSSFEERWQAWQAKGVAHDRAVRRKLAVAIPLLAATAAALFYLLAGR